MGLPQWKCSGDFTYMLKWVLQGNYNKVATAAVLMNLVTLLCYILLSVACPEPFIGFIDNAVAWRSTGHLHPGTEEQCSSGLQRL